MARKRLLDSLLSPDDQQRILRKIERIEARSSGEVRVHVTGRRVDDPLAQAGKIFAALGMTRTRRRNGVLVYLSLPSRKLAVVGDEGIDRVVAPGYWEELARSMSSRFAAGSFADGLLETLGRVEEVLAEHFPYEEGDINELPDDISVPAVRKGLAAWAAAGGIAAVAALLYLSWRLFFRGWS